MPTTTTSVRTFKTNSPSAEVPAPKKRPKLVMPKVPTTILPWLIIGVLCLLSIFLLVQYNEAQSKLQGGSQHYYEVQTKRLGKLILLPTSEKPTIVTVKDVSKLSGQKFYANAKNGDITFVYPQLQKAILYRPSNNLIINVAPISSPVQSQ